MPLPASLSNIAANKQDDVDIVSGVDAGTTTNVGDHAGHHNALAGAVNALEGVAAKSFSGRVFNIEMPPYNAVPADYYLDGVATSSSTTFTSATANFTGADVGKTIFILRAGDSSSQDHGTTIASVTNSTTVVLTHAAGRSHSPARFYLFRGGSVDTALNAAIQDCFDAGGGTVYLPGVAYTGTGITNKRRVRIKGAGQRATMYLLMAGSNRPIYKSDHTLNNSSDWTTVEDIWLDGNRKRQTEQTTTLAAAYTAGNSTMSLTAAPELPNGMMLVGTNRLLYNNVTGSGPYTVNVTGGMENTTDANASNGASVTIYRCFGTYLVPNPYNAMPEGVGNGAETFDPHHLVRNVYLRNIKSHGSYQAGQSDNRYENVTAELCDNHGFWTGYDTNYVSCTAATNGRAGWYCASTQVRLVNCASFYSGSITGSEGWGYLIEGPAILETGGKTLINCSAQDNKAEGLYVRHAQRVIFSGTLDSNGVSGTATEGVSSTYAACRLHGATNGIFDLTCMERKQDGTNAKQQHALEVINTAIITAGNNIRITHAGTQGVSVGPAIKPGSQLTTGNNISVNGQGGYFNPAFASPYTPDPYAATTHQMTLTGNLTVNAPANAHLGTSLRFVFIQDATGGRNVTFNSALPAVWAPSLQPGASSIIEFIYNGTAWVQVMPSSDVPLRKTTLADVTDSTTAGATTLTDLDFSLAANTDYTFSYQLWFGNVAATTTGLIVGITVPSGASVGATVNIPLTTTTEQVGFITASGGTVIAATTPAISTYYVARVNGFVRTAGTPGTLSVNFNPDANAAITVRRGSQGLLYVA